MSDETFVEGRTQAVKREITKRALEAGVDLNSIRVSPDGTGYLVPGELAPKKESGRRSRKKEDGEQAEGSAEQQGED